VQWFRHTHVGRQAIGWDCHIQHNHPFDTVPAGAFRIFWVYLYHRQLMPVALIRLGKTNLHQNHSFQKDKPCLFHGKRLSQAGQAVKRLLPFDLEQERDQFVLFGNARCKLR